MKMILHILLRLEALSLVSIEANEVITCKVIDRQRFIKNLFQFRFLCLFALRSHIPPACHVAIFIQEARQHPPAQS